MCQDSLGEDDSRNLISRAAGMRWRCWTSHFNAEIYHTRSDSGQAIREVVISCRGYFRKKMVRRVCLFIFIFLCRLLYSRNSGRNKFCKKKIHGQGDSFSMQKATQSCGEHCSSITAQNIFFLPEGAPISPDLFATLMPDKAKIKSRSIVVETSIISIVHLMDHFPEKYTYTSYLYRLCQVSALSQLLSWNWFRVSTIQKNLHDPDNRCRTLSGRAMEEDL